MLFWTTPTVRFSWLQQQARAVPSPCAISQTTTFWRHNCHAACKKAGTPTMISYYLRTSFFITVGPLGSPLTSSTKPSRCSTRRTAEARRWTPTDLLKAFHLREMATANIPDARQQALVSTWENAPPESVQSLFADYLYPNRLWSRSESVTDHPFAADSIDEFKGIELNSHSSPYS